MTGEVKSKTSGRRVGRNGEGEQNYNGDRIVEFFNKEDLAVVNIFLNKLICVMGIAD